MDQATLASWHDFYVTIGTASASLIGLLFVALSINVEVIAGPSREDLRAFAEQAFSNFATVLLVAVIFLVPSHDASSSGVAYVLLGGLGGARLLRRAPAIWRARRTGQLREVAFWRLVLPTAALVGLVAAGFGLISGDPSTLYWLVAVILAMLMSAARSSWDLLVRVGEDRHPATEPSAAGSGLRVDPPAAPTATDKPTAHD